MGGEGRGLSPWDLKPQEEPTVCPTQTIARSLFLFLSLDPFLCTQMGGGGVEGLSHPVCDLSLLADATS